MSHSFRSSNGLLDLVIANRNGLPLVEKLLISCLCLQGLHSNVFLLYVVKLASFWENVWFRFVCHMLGLCHQQFLGWVINYVEDI